MTKETKEIRSFTFDIRAEEDEKHGHMLTGRPIVYNQRTDLGWYDEIIDAGALDTTDLTDVRFLVNHNTVHQTHPRRSVAPRKNSGSRDTETWPPSPSPSPSPSSEHRCNLSASAPHL